MLNVESYYKKPIDLKLIINTWEICFNKKLNPDYLKWRFLNNLIDEKIYIKYIIEDGYLASFSAVSPVLLNIKGQGIKKAAFANMAMTLPYFRGKGYHQIIAEKLMQELEQDGYSSVFA